MASAQGDEGLYRRAIVNPSSLNQAEINTVLGWLSPEDDDRLCREKSGGKTRAELVAHALARPEQLTGVECDLLLRDRGFLPARLPPTDDLVEVWSRLADAVDAVAASYRDPPPQPQEDAYWAVWKGALGEDEKRAIELASTRNRAFIEELYAQRQREHADALVQIRRRTGTKWIRDMLQKGFDGGAHDCWGFVCFRTGGYDDGDGRAKERGSDEGSESAWEQFQKYYWHTAETVLLEWGSGDRLWPLFRTIFVSDSALDGASTDTLRARFKAMVEASEVPKGIRKDCFLIADEAAISSDETKRPYTGTNSPALSAHLPVPTVFVRAVHAAYPDIGPCLSYVPVPLPQPPSAGGEGGGGQGAAVTDPMASFTGEVTLALPKVFDFLHYALCEPTSRLGGWEAIYHQTEVPARFSSGFNPANPVPTYVSFRVFDAIPEEHPYRHRPQQ